MAEIGMHPTVKPVALVAGAILAVSKRVAPVLGPFGGSGSTLIAALRPALRHIAARHVRAWVTSSDEIAMANGAMTETVRG